MTELHLFLFPLTLSVWRHLLSEFRGQVLQAVEKRDIDLSWIEFQILGESPLFRPIPTLINGGGLL